MEGAKTAPVDTAGSCHLAGTVYSGRILPLPAKRHPRQQRDHLQRPAQIAEIMHFPPRPLSTVWAADPGVMHAVWLCVVVRLVLRPLRGGWTAAVVQPGLRDASNSNSTNADRRPAAAVTQSEQ